MDNLRHPDTSIGAWAWFAVVGEREGPLISSVVVSYRVRPEAVAEHVRLIQDVFEQLRAEHPDNIEYKVMCLDDGVSFVHVSTADTPDGSNPIPQLAAFQRFSQDAAARVATPPVPTAADIVGSYYPGAAGHEFPRSDT